MKVGTGSHTYEVVDGWGKLPEGISPGYTHGVVVDAHDNVYVHNQSANAVIKFDRAGNYRGSWGAEFAGGAHGFYLARENGGVAVGDDIRGTKGTEYLYLADYARHTVYKATLDGEIVLTLGVPDLPTIYDTPEKYKPTDTAVAPNGDIYVCDGYGQSWIHVYRPDGTRIRSFGGPGSEPGKLKCPHGVWIDTRGKEPILLVADRGNNRIQTFSLEGIPLGFVNYDLRMPCCFYEFGGELFIPDLHARVTVLDEKNDLVTHLGDRPGIWRMQGWPNIPHAERKPGLFSSPHAACVDSHGDVYVVEWISDGRITKLAKV